MVDPADTQPCVIDFERGQKTVLRLSNMKVLPKLAAVIALISLIVGGCVWYAQSRMTTIDDGYSRFIGNERQRPSQRRAGSTAS